VRIKIIIKQLYDPLPALKVRLSVVATKDRRNWFWHSSDLHCCNNFITQKSSSSYFSRWTGSI